MARDCFTVCPVLTKTTHFVTAFGQKDSQKATQMSKHDRAGVSSNQGSEVAVASVSAIRQEVRVHPRCKNGSCEIIQRLFETFGREKSCMIEQELFLQWVNSLLPQ